jgi:hypothetical protein
MLPIVRWMVLDFIYLICHAKATCLVLLRFWGLRGYPSFMLRTSGQMMRTRAVDLTYVNYARLHC